MTRYRIEQSLVLAMGFLLGAALAVCIAPGDVLLWVLAGAVLAIFCREHFVKNCAGEVFWWPHRHRHRPDRPVRKT